MCIYIYIYECPIGRRGAATPLPSVPRCGGQHGDASGINKKYDTNNNDNNDDNNNNSKNTNNDNNNNNDNTKC